MYTPASSTLLTPLLFLFLSLSKLPCVSATPPACLLAAINEQAHPSDLKSLCGTTLEDAVAGNITEKCRGDAYGHDYKEAVSAYQAACLEGAGVNISITSSSPSASASASTTKTGTASSSGTATATASSSSSSSGAKATGSAARASKSAGASGAEALVVPGLLGFVGVGLVGAVLF
ncbi:hypothetical protein DSL72_001621 [Monilinia vaccinii-corymbosi]|uniref:Extracellular membrane protein CFEM domain-containing protein n=1 Tax=Monilinia vaccinii-corymbosi TaxID=61207 RepID=A0A8A3P495_9HELO|nr:hypothetical protein DSL72_001621 [Monilinia vaccinii-corymbosi]